MQVSCLKKGEKDHSIVMRLYNPSGNEAKAEIVWWKEIRKAELLDLKEDVVGQLIAAGNRVPVTVPSYKIYTVRFVMEETV